MSNTQYKNLCLLIFGNYKNCDCIYQQNFVLRDDKIRLTQLSILVSFFQSKELSDNILIVFDVT